MYFKTMALYETFFIITKIVDDDGDLIEEKFEIRTLDMNRIEDFGPEGEDRTSVSMYCGREYLISMNHVDFGNTLFEEVDGMGKLLKFNLN